MSAPSRDIATELFGILFDHCSEAVFAIHRQTGLILTANERFEDLTGRSLFSLTNFPARLLFAQDDLFERPGLHEEVSLIPMGGYPTTMSLTVAHVDHPRFGMLCACIARDTTERRLLERELLEKHVGLHAAHADLERAVESLEERNRELQLLAAKLSQAARRILIGELSAGIAHSLNNPMGALVSSQRQMVQAIEAQAPPELVEVTRRCARRSQDAIARMEQIVQAVRRAHRTGSLSADPRELMVADEIEIALSLFESRLLNVRITRTVEPELRAVAPPTELQHVLANIIDNALLAMGERGEVLIEASRVGAMCTIQVRDSGPGIPADVASQLFEPFVTARTEGSGLGLSTARRVARAWGGDVMLRDADRGACFVITLPIKEAACPSSNAS